MHQQCFAGLQAAALKHVVPHRKHGFGQRRSFSHAEAGRHGQAVAGIGYCIFGIATGGQQGTHRIAQVPARYGGSAGFDGAGYFQAGHEARYVAAPGVFALAH